MGYTCQRDTWFSNHTPYFNRNAVMDGGLVFSLDQWSYHGRVKLQEHTSRGKEKWLLALTVYSQSSILRYCTAEVSCGQSFILSSFFTALLPALFHRRKYWRRACFGELMGVEKLPILFLSTGHFLLIYSVFRNLVCCTNTLFWLREEVKGWWKLLGERKGQGLVLA